MKISIGADHQGFELKKYLMRKCSEYTWLDKGTDSQDRTDYPVFAKQVCNDVLNGDADFGILSCATGVGMSIAANRCRGIYAALAWAQEVAELARQHDGANILILPAQFLPLYEAMAITKVFLAAEFLGGRYQERLVMIDD